MEGHSKCPLYVSDEETANHMLLMCPFAQEVWRGVLMLGLDQIELPRNIPYLLRKCAKLSPFCLSKKVLLKTSWMWIPKFTCWKLWLERNNKIFKEESCNPIRIITKIKTLLGEALEAKRHKKWYDSGQRGRSMAKRASSKPSRWTHSSCQSIFSLGNSSGRIGIR